MTPNQNLQAAAKPKKSKKTGNTFITFNIRDTLNTAKNIPAAIAKMAAKMDEESNAFAGVPCSGLVYSSSPFEFDGVYFKGGDGELYCVYSTGGSGTSVSFIVSRLTPENAKEVKKSDIKKPFAFKPKSTASLHDKIEAAAQRVQAAFKADEEHDIEVVAKQVMMALDPSLQYDTVKKFHTVHCIWEWDDAEFSQDIKAMDLTLAELGFRKQPGSADLLKYESNNWGLVIGPDISTLVVIQL